MGEVSEQEQVTGPIHMHTKSDRHNPKHAASHGSATQQKDDTKPAIGRSPSSSLLAKQKKVKKEGSREERLSEVPMFLI